MDDLNHDLHYHLQEEHRRLNEAQAIGSIGSFEWNIGDETVTWSDEMYRINGLEPQSELITIDRTHSLIHPDDLAKVLEFKEAAFAAPGRYALQHRIVLKDGTIKWVAHRFESLPDESEKITRVHGTLQDITDLKQTEEELIRIKDELAQRTADKYLTLFNSIDEGFVLGKAIRRDDGTSDFLYEDVNPAYTRMLGIDKEVLIGRTAREAFPDLKEHWYEIVEKVGFGRQSVYLEDFAEPSSKWLNTYFSPFGAPEEGRIAGVLSDITARKKAEERQAFLLKLNDAIRPLASPQEIQAVSADLLGKYLGANQAHYGEVVGEYVHVYHSYAAGLPPMTGSFRHQDFGQQTIAGFRAGQVQVCANTTTDQNLSEAKRTVLASAYMGAYVAVPLVKGGEWVAMLAVHNIEPRNWSQMETELVEEAAERTWAAVERAKAEQALRKAEEGYRHQLEKDVEQRTKELQESKELLQTAFDTTVTGLAVFNAVRDENKKIIDFEFQFLNKEAIRYYGGDLKGKRYAELHPGIKLTEVFNHYVKAVEEAEPQDFELHYQIEGYDNWFRIIAVKLSDGVLMSYEDITARKKAEAERQKHLTLLHQSEALASIGSWEYDIPTGKFTWSEGLYSLFEIEPEREVTPEIYLQLAIDEHKQIAEQVVKSIKGELAPIDETLHLKINEQERIVKIKTTIIKDEEGRPIRALGVDMDVTATQKAQAQLKEQAHFIQNTNQALPDILFVMSVDTKEIIYINHPVEKRLGYTNEQAKKMSHPFFDAIHEDDLPEVLVHIERMQDAADGEVREIEYRRVDGRGAVRWYKDRNSVFKRDAQGQVVQKVGITQDITESKKAEQELKDSNRSLRYANENLQQFASIASHDLQEPLRKLKMFTSVLNRYHNALPEEGKELIDKISITSDRMRKLISEVLQYSKIAYGAKEFVPTNLDSILKNVFGDLELLLEETKAVIDYKEPLPQIDAIPPQMNQLFYNLLTNALKFQKDQGKPVVTISFAPVSTAEIRKHPELNEDKKYIGIRFSDNGIGFEQDYAEQIFQIFERLHPVDEFDGTGVGLALCKKIVENHSGHIYAVSRVGEGASFYILLPVRQ